MEAQTLDASQMRELQIEKRYTLMLALIQSKYAQTLDDLAKMFLKRMQTMHHRAKDELTLYRKRIQGRLDELITTFRDLVVAYNDDGDIVDRLTAMNQVLGDQSPALIEECEAYLTYAGNNYLPFLVKFYRSHRAALFQFLEAVPLHSSTQDKSLEKAIAFIQAHRNTRKLWVSAVENTSDNSDSQSQLVPLDLSWVPSTWWSLVTGQKKRNPYPEKIQQRYLELCVFSHILLGLRAGDLYIEGSYEFDDYYRQLISWEEYDARVEEYGKLLNIPTDPKKFVTHVRQWLTSVAKKTDQSFPQNSEAYFKNQRLVIRRAKSKHPKGLEELRTLITERIKPVSLLDILIDTEHWLNWTRFFGPISGYEAKIEQPVPRYLATIFGFGCNIGTTQLAGALKKFDRKQLALIDQRYITEDKLQGAIVSIINAYNRFSLPKYWGTGKRASVDGTKWDMYENNLLAEYHIRYGGYGGIGYYHISDTYIALFSHFIACGVYEGIFMIDGLINNTSDIQPDTIHGDTHAQSATVYGLAYLLGINLMPRIRRWQDLDILRPERTTRYQHIDPLFNSTVNWSLIKTHLPDMLRVVLSIKAGKISASTILRKLGTNSRNNKLYQAFHALGCAVRTGFLMQFIDDPNLRSMIQSETNKCESFHSLSQWIAFGGEGSLNTNDRDEQRKRIKYNHLVANCIIFYNVYEISRILNELVQEGYRVEPEAIAALSPYLRHHINRFGRYSLDVDRHPPMIEYELPVIADVSE